MRKGQQESTLDSRFLINDIATRRKKEKWSSMKVTPTASSLSFLLPCSPLLILGPVVGDAFISPSYQPAAATVSHDGRPMS